MCDAAGARHVPVRLCGGLDYLGPYVVCVCDRLKALLSSTGYSALSELQLVLFVVSDWSRIRSFCYC